MRRYISLSASDGRSFFPATSLCCGVIALAANACCVRALATDTTNVTTAERLVADALRAEVAGQGDQRTALLDEAVGVAPDFAPARWQSGQIERDGRWVPVGETQQ